MALATLLFIPRRACIKVLRSSLLGTAQITGEVPRWLSLLEQGDCPVYIGVRGPPASVPRVCAPALHTLLPYVT